EFRSSSGVGSMPCSRSTSTSAPMLYGSLSTITPSRSKITAAGLTAVDHMSLRSPPLDQSAGGGASVALSDQHPYFGGDAMAGVDGMGGVKRCLGARMAAGLLAVSMTCTTAPGAWAASHREAPLIALDPAADLTDVYAFRSWEDPSKAVFIMNVIPSQVPASGPNFFNLDDQVLYGFHFDLNQDGKSDDLNIEFRFTTQI